MQPFSRLLCLTFLCSLWQSSVTLAQLAGIRTNVVVCFEFCFLSDWACLSLVGWLLAVTPLLSLTHDVLRVYCLLPGLQMSMYSESKGS